MAEARTVPYHWWGDAWRKSNELTLPDLVVQEVLTEHAAGLLVASVSAGESVVVVADGSGVGKSTLAFALLPYLPQSRKAIYLRGSHEQYLWTSAVTASQTTLLVNEISDHLPVYLHGAALRKAVELIGHGVQLIATAHPDGLESLLAALDQVGSPSRKPLSIVELDNCSGPPSRVNRIVRSLPTSGLQTLPV